jgi:probable rRNA maturation factor
VPTPRLELSVQYACGAKDLPKRAEVRAWARAALPPDRARNAEIALRFVDEEEARALNRDYRGKDSATNVLSFSYETDPLLQGDLVVCVPVLKREAAEHGMSLSAHCAHLIVHGLLHLQGYDHETGEADATAMEAKEREIMESLGFPDPYSTDSTDSTYSTHSTHSTDSNPSAPVSRAPAPE